MKLLKWMFSTTSPSKKYIKELVLLGLIIVCFILLIFLIDNLKMLELFATILRLISTVFTIILVLISVLRLFDIADYNEKNKIKKGKFNFKYNPMNYKVEDIFFWAENSQEPNTLYVKGKNEIIILEVSYETEGKNGPFVNKKIYINDYYVKDIKEFMEKINDECAIEDNLISVYAITEFNNPKLFATILSEMKK